MSTAAGNKYGVTCNGNTCVDPDGNEYVYDKDASTVTMNGTESFPVASTPEGMDNPVNIGDVLPGASGYIDVPEN